MNIFGVVDGNWFWCIGELGVFVIFDVEVYKFVSLVIVYDCVVDLDV